MHGDNEELRHQLDRPVRARERTPEELEAAEADIRRLLSMLAYTQEEKRKVAMEGVSVHIVDGENSCDASEFAEMKNIGGTSQHPSTQTEPLCVSYTETWGCRPPDMAHLLSEFTGAIASAIQASKQGTGNGSERGELSRFTARQSATCTALPKFSGSPNECPAFMSVFHSTNTERSYRKAENAHRLQTCRKGPAKVAVRLMLAVPELFGPGGGEGCV